MLDLKGKMLDPNILPGQKAEIQKQIDLQDQAVALSKEQEGSEKERLKNLALIFGIERKTLDAKQQAAANQQRASAASKGFEGALQEDLNKLDSASGMLKRIERRIVGQIETPGKPTLYIYEDVVKVVDASNTIPEIWKSITEAIDGASKGLKGYAAENKNAIKTAKDLSKVLLKPGIAGGGNLQSQSNMSSEERRYLRNKNHMDQVIAAAKKDKSPLDYAYSSEGLMYSAGANAMSAGYSKKGYNTSWFGDEELAGMKKIEKATNMTSDAFFNASNQATYLERTLKAIGKDPGNIEEKMKWYARALSQTTQNSQNPQPPSDFDKQSRALANKGWLGAFDVMSGNEGTGDKLAAQLADADAAAKNLKGSIDGVRDSVGNLQIPNVDGPVSGRNQEQLYKEWREASEAALRVNNNTNDMIGGQDQFDKGLDGALEKTKDLYKSWEDVHDAIINSADALKVYSDPPTARWAGGWLGAGQTADTINELGMESFLSRSGVLSLIRAPAYSSWTAPSPGMVLPAGITARLDAMGAFDRGGSSQAGLPLSASFPIPAGGPGGGGFTAVVDRLERRMATLEDAMRSYRPMDVQVAVPSNAGQLHTLMSFR
jgi:hypothetical protein